MVSGLPSLSRPARFAAILLPILQCVALTQAWVLVSRQSTQLTLDAAFDSVKRKMVITGTIFRTSYKDITLAGNADTDCFVAVGDARGFDRAVFETPQLCTHSQVFPPDLDEAIASRGVSGVSVGIDGEQAVLATMDLSGEYADLQRSNTILLPFQQFPVAVTTDAQGGIYVGMHDTAGILLPPAPENEVEELMMVYEYYHLMTHPTKSESLTSPKVVKASVSTQDIEWELDLETELGKSTIGNVVHIPSRGYLVVVGSSSGRGSTVGAGAFSISWDGYVTKINATTGTVDTSSSDQTHLAAQHSLRIQSQVGRDDFITGACVVDDQLIVVGSTNGRMAASATENGGAFAMRLDIDTLNIRWSYQWTGAGVEAIKCHANNSTVWIAGHVPEGVLLQEDDTRTYTSLDQDVFVSLLNFFDGEMQWTRQIDSRYPDLLAGIVYFAHSGNIAVISNAMDFERGVSDTVTAQVLASGSYDWQQLPQSADPINGNGTTFTGGDAATPPTESNTELNFDDNETKVIIVATVIPIVILLLVIAYTLVSRNREVEKLIAKPANAQGMKDTEAISEAQPAPANTGVI